MRVGGECAGGMLDNACKITIYNGEIRFPGWCACGLSTEWKIQHSMLSGVQLAPGGRGKTAYGSFRARGPAM